MPYAEDDPETSPRVAALREGFQKLGWTEGQNIRSEHRYWSVSDAAAIHKLAREIVDSGPDVILTDTTPVTEAVLHETRTIPVVFVQVGDPVGSGFVASFPHPGGNATGFKLPPYIDEQVARVAHGDRATHGPGVLLVQPSDRTLLATVFRTP